MEYLTKLAAKLFRCCKTSRAGQPKQNAKSRGQDINKNVDNIIEEDDSAFPTYPPPAPQTLLTHPTDHWARITACKYLTPRGVDEDTPLFALYRLYECFVLDRVLAYRNWLEWLWRQHRWRIVDIPDPRDERCPARYAFLAGCTYLIVRAFNARVQLGLTRGARPIMLIEEVEEARNRPDSERPYESVPAWAERVAPLDKMLVIPTREGEVLSGPEDERADGDFLEKNILLWTPHIHFT